MGATSTLGGSGDGSGCIDLRTIVNATAPPASTKAPTAANTNGRHRRLDLRESAITWEGPREPPGRHEFLRDGFLRIAELLGEPALSMRRVTLADADRAPCQLSLTVPHVTSIGPTAEYFRPRLSRWLGVNRTSVFELMSTSFAA